MWGRNVYLCFDLIDTKILDYAKSKYFKSQT